MEFGFYQTCTERKPPKVPSTVHSRHPVTPSPGGHGIVPSAGRHLQHTAHALQRIVDGNDAAVFPVLSLVT